jgi:hypothetical protein
MAASESLNTMFQNSFEAIDADAGEYALRITGSSGGTAQTVVITEPIASRATSVFANGKLAAPAAGADIAVTSDLSTGTWDVTCTIAILGTTVANNETDNVKFKIGDTVVATPTLNVPGTTGSAGPTVWSCRVNLGAPTPVSLEVGGAAATADSIYVADIVATKWESS